ncbi:MAG: MucR family transcriptional regulator [Hyphomonadaceae bacterium]
MAGEANNRDDGSEVLRLTCDVVSSFLTRNTVAAEALPDLIRSVHRTFTTLSGEAEQRAESRPKPAISIGKSVTDEYIVCLEDGRKLKMLKRYLRTRYNMSPEEYRRRWGLPADYPMVAPSYTETRSEHAKKIGLGKSTRRER